MSSWDSLGAVERTAIAEEIVSTLRHDLRNRFAIIRNAAFYIQRKVAQSNLTDARTVQFLKAIDEESVAASALIDDPVSSKLLFLRRAAPTDAAACLRTAAACARIDATSIRVEVEPGEGEVHADVAEIALAVRCLVENAAEAMPGGGVVTLRGSAAEARYLIEVIDTGEGLSDPQYDSMLQPFYTTKPGHVGLGLNIARRVAQRYGGSLSVEPGVQGTSARLDLPLSAAGPQRSP